MNITNKLSITKDEFKALYPNADHEVFYRDPKNDVEFIERFLTNKLWRLNNLYTITDKMGMLVPFIMNSSQHMVYKASLLHSRVLILKSRQQGISTFWLLSFFDDSIFDEYLDVGLMSQGRSESGTLLTRTKLAWNKLDGSIKSFLNVSLKKDNADEVGLSNGSTIFIRTSFRSATLQRLHISEYGKICNKYPERAKETKTGTMQAIAPGNTLVIESTAEGHNDFKAMWDKSYGRELSTLGPKEFLAVFLSWLDDDTCVSKQHREPNTVQAKYFAKVEQDTGRIITEQQKNFWIDQYEELEENNGMVANEGEELLSSSIYQEYPSTPDEAFKSIRDGTYYAHAYQKHVLDQGRKVEDLYDWNLPVEVACDLGMNDTFVLIFFQVWQGSYRIIHEYKNNGLGIEHYANYMKAVDVLQKPIKGHPCADYHITTVHLPWDAEVVDLTSGISRFDRFIECGIRNLNLLPKLSVAVGIELVRKIIPELWIDETCVYTDSCMLNYSKEWDEKSQTWKEKPRKSDFCHGADTVRYLRMSRERGKKTVHAKKQEQRRRKHSGVVDGMAI